MICRLPLPSLHQQISWIPLESGKVSYFPLHLLPAMAREFHFLLRPGSAILHFAVLLARVKAVGLVACRRPARERGSRQAVAAVSVAARFSPGLDRFFAVADLSVAAGPDLAVVAVGSVAVVAVVAAVAAVASGFDLVAGSACPVCSVDLFAVETEKGRAAALVVFYS